MFPFQFAASVDIYSLSILFFELLSGKNPFPGDVYQVLLAKMSDKKPAVPSDFPGDLKELVFQGYSKEPRERPALEDFQSALKKMLAVEETQDQLPNLSEKKSSNEREEDQLDPQSEVQLALEEKLRLENILAAATEGGNSI
jgi:serine/threonine protein kinase